MRITHVGSLCAILLCSLPLAARADIDACKVLTPAEVSAAVGTAVSAGEYVTPSFVRTCTWNASGASPVRFVTLYTQTAAAYDHGKQGAAMMAAGGAAVTPAAIGDDAYYFVTGSQVGLLVKKGNAAFKVTVYAKLPVAQKQAMELALAKVALAKLP